MYSPFEKQKNFILNVKNNNVNIIWYKIATHEPKSTVQRVLEGINDSYRKHTYMFC